MKTPGSPPGDRPEVEAPQGVQLTGTNQSESYSLWNHLTAKLVSFVRDVVAMQFSGNNGIRASESGALPSKVSGAYSGGATPVPIPNTAVKPTNADGTRTAGSAGE